MVLIAVLLSSRVDDRITDVLDDHGLDYEYDNSAPLPCAEALLCVEGTDWLTLLTQLGRALSAANASVVSMTADYPLPSLS